MYVCIYISDAFIGTIYTYLLEYEKPCSVESLYAKDDSLLYCQSMVNEALSTMVANGLVIKTQDGLYITADKFETFQKSGMVLEFIFFIDTMISLFN